MPTGRTLFVDLRSAIGRGILATREFDPALTRYLSEIIGAGDCFIDVGANVGVFSLLASDRTGPCGETHAFEVDPRALRCLGLTQKRNRLTNLVVHATALGDRCGTISLSQSGEVGHTFIRRSSSASLTFPVMTLDCWADYFSARRVRVIKIDVEGAELPVLRGATRLLRACSPEVICESEPGHQARFGYNESDLVEHMAALGYSVRSLPGTNDGTLVFTHTRLTSPGE